jgi:hypothetical protein
MTVRAVSVNNWIAATRKGELYDVREKSGVTRDGKLLIAGRSVSDAKNAVRQRN